MFAVRRGPPILTTSKLVPSMSLYGSYSLILALSLYVCVSSHENGDIWCLLQLRVSSLLSNGSYVLVLDCDMYSNDPTSAKAAMCFHLDPTLSSSLAFVQFPQMFHNISPTDIYCGQFREVFKVHPIITSEWPIPLCIIDFPLMLVFYCPTALSIHREHSQITPTKLPAQQVSQYFNWGSQLD